MAQVTRHFAWVTRFAGALAIGAGVALASSAAAQDFPTRAIRMFVPFAPGGPADQLARAIAPGMSSALGQPVFVENRPGAGGMTGVDGVAKSPPDGYTLGITGPGALVAAPFMTKAPYDPEKDVVPLARIARVKGVIVVSGTSQYKTLADLVAAARNAPGKMSFGSAGAGTLTHLAGELLNMEAGAKMVHVPYRGAAPAVTDLLGGHIHALLPDLPGVLPQIKAGSIRALAVTSAERSPSIPDVPTTREAGLERVLSDSWYGLIAPHGTPAPVLKKLADAALDALKTHEVASRIEAQGALVAPAGPEEFARLIREEQQRWKRVIDATGAKME